MNDIEVLNVNCRSIRNKIDVFAALISVTNPSIVIGTESWLEESLSDLEVFPPHFAVYRKDRNGNGGGVFLLIHERLKSFLVEINGLSCESVWCRVSLANGDNLTVGSFYRSPSSNINSIFFSLYNALFLVEGGFFSYWW